MKNTLRVAILMAVAGILSAVGSPAAESAPRGGLVLASGGTAHFVIYHGPGEDDVVTHAAEELGQWLGRITGADFQVTTDASDSHPKIVVGRNNTLAEAIEERLDLGSVHDDGFRILTDSGNLYLVGAIDRGTLYAVYHLLDLYFGVHWLAPDFEVVPRRDPLAVGEMDVLENPRFSYREIFSGDTDDAYFRQHNRLNGNRGGTHREELEYPPEIDTWSKDAPSGGDNFQEIVAPVYHRGGQIDVMNPAVRAQAAAYFVDRIQTDGPEPWYAFSQQDNGWDPDEDSLAFAEEHGGALSAPILDMLIDVTSRVRQTIPNAHLSTTAYQWSFQPPTGMTVPPWVMVEIAPIESDLGHPFDDTVHNEAAYRAFTGWNAISTTLAVWDYHANFQNYLQPLPNLRAMFSNIQLYSRLGAIRSLFGEGAYNTSGAEFADLRAWVAARLMWNPDQDWEVLIDQFCDGYYGPDASPYIRQYIDLLQRSFDESGQRLGAKERITSPYLNLDFVREADRLLETADAMATGAYSRHVHEVRIGVDMTILLREHEYAAEAAKGGITWVHDPDRRARFERYTAEAGIEEYAEDGSLDQLLAAMDIHRVAPPDPGFLAPGSEWIDFQDLDFSYCCGAAMVEDPQASDHGAVSLDNGEWAIWLPLDVLPPGKRWTLYAAVRAETRSGADTGAGAFNMGLEPGSWITPTVAEMQDGRYHWFQFPEMPVAYRTGSDVWFSVETEQTVAIHVDRIVAVASRPGPRSPSARVLPASGAR